MSIGNEMAYRRSRRGKDATGSLVFDAEREQARQGNPDGPPQPIKRKVMEKFPG